MAAKMLIPTRYILDQISKWDVVIILCLLKLFLHLVTNQNYGFHRDEFLYLIQGDHLAWGFMSVPPNIGFFGWLIQLFGTPSAWVVRLVPTFLGVLTVLLTMLMAREMGGGKFGPGLAGLAVIISPLFLRINGLFQPVSFNVFYWCLLAYLFIRYLKTEQTRFILLIGFVMGVGMLNKYSILLFGMGIFVGLLASDQRKVFLQLTPYLAAGIALLTFLPNLIWQIQQGFPLVTHMQELSRYQLRHVEPLNFILDQLLFNLPSLFVWIAGLIFLLFIRGGKLFRPVAWIYLTVIGVLLFLSGKSYYGAGAYPMLMAAGGVYLERLTKSPRRLWLRIVLPVLIVTNIIPVLPVSLPVLQIPALVKYCDIIADNGLESAVRWEDGVRHELPQDFADMLGWQELTDIVNKTYQGLEPREKDRCMIYAGNYGQAGSISYLGKTFGLPEVVSLNGSFYYWSPDTIQSDILIYVDYDPTLIKTFFKTVTLMGKIETQYAREKGLPVYLCKGPLVNFTEEWRKVKYRAEQ